MLTQAVLCRLILEMMCQPSHLIHPSEGDLLQRCQRFSAKRATVFGVSHLCKDLTRAAGRKYLAFVTPVFGSRQIDAQPEMLCCYSIQALGAKLIVIPASKGIKDKCAKYQRLVQPEIKPNQMLFNCKLVQNPVASPTHSIHSSGGKPLVPWVGKSVQHIWEKHGKSYYSSSWCFGLSLPGKQRWKVPLALSQEGFPQLATTSGAGTVGLPV